MKTAMVLGSYGFLGKLSFPLMEGYEKLYDLGFFFKTKRKLKFISEEDNGIKAIWSKKTSVISIDVCLKE